MEKTYPPPEVWTVIQRGGKADEFLAGFVQTKAIWSRDRTVALTWKSNDVAREVLRKLDEKDGKGAALAPIGPSFARNLQLEPAAKPKKPAAKPTKKAPKVAKKASKQPRRQAA